LLFQTGNVGVVFGSAGKDYVSHSQLDEDVVVYLLSDTIDIDSKMMTFIKDTLSGTDKNKVYDLLYKYDATN